MGEVFAGRYELVDPVGHGGVGAVWRAWDHRRHRYVAAKVLQQSDAHSLLRFVREQALRIDHPHVLAPASWAADDDKVLFTMDLVAGGSLAHVIGDYGPLPPRFACTLLDQLLSGLAAVHAEGVVHRDIKPANILLEATGAGRPHLRLSDFGISMRKGEPRLTETDYVVGTPGYFAPEQMMGAEPDFPADLFAVGLVALYLLEGAKPDAKALIEHFAEHGTPRAPQGMPEPLWQVIATLLQPDPQTRFRTATGARKALASAAEMLPEPGPDDELVEIFDQLAPLPTGFGPDGPLNSAPRRTPAQGSVPAPSHVPPAPGHAPAPVIPEAPTTPPRPMAAPAPLPTSTSHPASASGPPVTSDRSFGWDPSLTPGPRAVSDPPTGSNSSTVPDPSTASAPSTASDTGSFPLPPPQQPTAPPSPFTPPAPVPPQAPTPEPTHATSPHQAHRAPADDPSHAAAVTSSVNRPHAPTYPYTAHAAQVPPPSQPVPSQAAPSHAAPNQAAPSQVATQPRPAHAHSHSHSRVRPRRPGPPAKVAVPMLLIALACLTVGFWALAQI
ncbi:serine/threonine protein kinase [Streptomyces kanamyceticus]|uniref:non-specific serine/threonine protein kinase n=1 Tax=Streptomyces kanamyceticus TaxID=1967 RepID=A0A5J6GC75_STRKN|nr:serine/threonine-protein kinase [Streptomyces kanamyceticus]QEU93109.1 serine/threonine protein kinase [Streptomyces kanamyceticus]